MFDLSIVLPTCNRAGSLDKTLSAIESQTRCDHEIIAVDGASNDSTPAILQRWQHNLGDRLRIIREERREGFVKAVNKGFRQARGKYLTWLNDDARPLNNALDKAVAQMNTEPADTAFVAMFHAWQSLKNIAYETSHNGHIYRLCHIRGTLYANFPVGKTRTFEQLGYFDERFFVCAADPDLSLAAWHAGMRVVPAYGAIIDHDEIEDNRRTADSSRAEQDNAKLFAKWDVPPANPFHNDFDPANPCKLRGLKEILAVKTAA